jgi:hypothetical protein
MVSQGNTMTFKTWNFTNEHGEKWKAIYDNDTVTFSGEDIDWHCVSYNVKQVTAILSHMNNQFKESGLITLSKFFIDQKEAEWVLSILEEVSVSTRHVKMIYEGRTNPYDIVLDKIELWESLIIQETRTFEILSKYETDVVEVALLTQCQSMKINSEIAQYHKELASFIEDAKLMGVYECLSN